LATGLGLRTSLEGILKKFLYIFLGFIGVVVTGLLIAPLFISIDKFRPQIVTAVESKLRAKVSIGELSLRLFPTFKVSSDSLIVTPLAESGFDQPVVNSKSMAVEASLFSFLTSPSLSFQVNEPTLNVTAKNKKTNIAEILPVEGSAETQTAVSSGQDAAAEASSPDSALSELPAWLRTRVEAASFSVFVRKAHVIYEDLDAGSKTDLSKVDFSLKDIGLNQTMLARFDAQVDFKGDGLSAAGPVTAEVEIVSSTNSDGQLSLDMKGSKDFSSLDLQMTDLFVKKPGIPFGVSFAGKMLVAKVINVDMTAMNLDFGTLAIKGSLKASDLTGAAQVELNLKSSSLNLADLKSYSPMIANYKLLGKADFSAEVKGTLDNPSLNFAFTANEVQGSSPDLATPIKNLSADVRIGGTLNDPLVDVKKVQLAIGKASDLALRGTVRGIKAPVVDFSVESKNLDLDEIMGTPAASAPASASSKGAAKTEEPVSTLPLDESLNQMAPTIDEALKNPMLDVLRAKLQTKLAKVKFMGAEYLDAGLLVTLEKRRLNISKTSLRAYKGVVALSGSMHLVPNETEFQFSTNLSNVAMGDVVKAHAPDWVGALSGSVLGLFEISGKGLTKDHLQKNLRGNIQGEIKNGKTNLAVVKVVNQVMASIPKNISSALSSKAEESTKNQYIEGDFETMKLSANIVGRKVNLKTLDAVFKSSQTQLGKFRFMADGFVTFDQDVNMSGTAFLSPQLVRVPQLRGKSGQVEIPLKFGGKMYEPEIDYQYSLKRISETAGKNLLQTEGKKAAEKLLPALQKNAPKSLKKNVKDLKKLFN
jgi:hypothetical protein